MWDRWGAIHMLKPVLDGDPDAFLTSGDDEQLQRAWAKEQGLPEQLSLDEILLCQIEAHRTEVFYNLDPMRYGDDFLARLPGCVKRTVAWRAAPSKGGKFLRHDILVNNFPVLLQEYRDQGVRAEYFTPAYDPVMDEYAANADRPIDVIFVGGYSRHHTARSRMIEAVARLYPRFNIALHFDRSRVTMLADSPLGLVWPLRKHRRPAAVRHCAKGPLFGRELYAAYSKAKIVVNGAVDLKWTTRHRGNMRCWEALGCGAGMLTDAGIYPEGMTDGVTMVTYSDETEILGAIKTLLGQPARLQEIRSAGHKMIRSHYSKERQWTRFQEIVA